MDMHGVLASVALCVCRMREAKKEGKGFGDGLISVGNQSKFV